MKLRPGMTATATILVDKREDVLRIPILATRFQPPDDVLKKISGGQSAVENEMKKMDSKNTSEVMKSDTLKKSRPAFAQQNDEQREKFMEGAKKFRGEFAQKFDRESMGRNWKQNPQGDLNKNMNEKKSFFFTRLWILKDKNTPKAITVRTGINDSRWVELLDDKLKEGDEVIIGITSSNNVASSQQNPFGPQRMMMGGGGGMGRR